MRRPRFNPHYHKKPINPVVRGVGRVPSYAKQKPALCPLSKVLPLPATLLQPPALSSLVTVFSCLTEMESLNTCPFASAFLHLAYLCFVFNEVREPGENFVTGDRWGKGKAALGSEASGLTMGWQDSSPGVPHRLQPSPGISRPPPSPPHPHWTQGPAEPLLQTGLWHTMLLSATKSEKEFLKKNVK